MSPSSVSNLRSQCRLMQHDADTTYPRCVSATMVFFPGFSAEEVVNHATSSVDAAVVYLFVVVAPFLFISEG